MSIENPTPEEIEAMLAVDAGAGSIQPSTSEKGILADNILKNMEGEKLPDISLSTIEDFNKNEAEQKNLVANILMQQKDKEIKSGLAQKTADSMKILQNLKARADAEAKEESELEAKIEADPKFRQTEQIFEAMKAGVKEGLETKSSELEKGPSIPKLSAKGIEALKSVKEMFPGTSPDILVDTLEALSKGEASSVLRDAIETIKNEDIQKTLSQSLSNAMEAVSKAPYSPDTEKKVANLYNMIQDIRQASGLDKIGVEKVTLEVTPDASLPKKNKKETDRLMN